MQKEYKLKDFSHLKGLPGISDQLFENHFALYKGYVTNANSLIQKFDQFQKEEKLGTPEYNELKRRFGWEMNGVILHEYYFENLTKENTGQDIPDNLKQLFETSFGSFENWKNEFIKTLSLRGIGWAILYFDPKNQNLFNTWINEHDTGHLAGMRPLLVIDAFEHAFMLDYGTNKPAYIENIIKLIDWSVVKERM